MLLNRKQIVLWSFNFLVVSLFFLCANIFALDITLDPQKPGRMFDGIGAVSAGASSRLLIDYPDMQRSQILDYLFKPDYGAALQHLKIEIGGGINSTDGTEPTFERTRGNFNFSRGYEWWLMQQARLRNPNIDLDCLAWGAPGWIGNGNYYSQDMCDYIASFIKGAQTNYGLNFNFTGTHNEASLNATRTSWIKQLRSTLDEDGLQSVQLVAADEWGGSWNIVTNPVYGLLMDPALSNSIARVGAHYPKMSSPAAALNCGIPLWDSEEGAHGTSWSDAMKLAQMYNKNYILGKMTATEVWSPITSYYDILAAPNSGLMKANTPWSGNYLVSPEIWVTAHTTQFAAPGWTYLEGGASALLPDGGSIVTLESTNHSDFSIVVETSDATTAQTITFHLTNGLSTASVHIWQTTQTNYFTQIGHITPGGGTFSYTFQPDCIYSLTTTTGQTKGSAQPLPPAPFPMPYKDDFEDYSAGVTPKYFSDQAGTFETFTRTGSDGQCLRQVSPQDGIRWTAEWQPYTLIGDASWSDYDVSADVLIETNRGLAFVMGRVGRGAGFSDAAPRGYWLALNNANSEWQLYAATNLIAAGPADASTGGWHNLRLAMQGASLRCYVNQILVTNITDETYISGMAGLGCGGWYGAQFDNFTLRPLHRDRMNLAPGATASASSVWQNDPTYAANMSNDGDPDTRWNSAYPTAPSAWLELDWSAPVTFNQTSYSQFDNRINGYQIQHWTGSNWVVDVNGGVMGAFATDTFATVTTSKVRLVLTNFTSTPSIYEFEIYNNPNPPLPNLASSATASASSVWQNNSTYAANMANDNDPTTRWNSAAGDTNGAWLELDWPSAMQFNRATLAQFANRITSYKIQHWNGSSWSDDFSGGQFGANTSDSFPTVTSSKARFFVVTATNVPSIYEFQVFDDPPVTASAIAPIRINEWMINNTHTLADPTGGYVPWFELYNAGSSNINLAGYSLIGSPANLFQFQIPTGYIIAPGGFLLVWTDGQTGSNSGADLHVNFSLAQSSLIALFNTTGEFVDGVDLLPQATDASSGSLPDGDAVSLNLLAATPGRSNNQIWALPPVRSVADGTMFLRFVGLPFASYRLLAATNLVNSAWTTLASVFADGLGQLTFTDTNARVTPKRFYRAVTP